MAFSLGLYSACAYQNTLWNSSRTAQAVPSICPNFSSLATASQQKPKPQVFFPPQEPGRWITRENQGSVSLLLLYFTYYLPTGSTDRLPTTLPTSLLQLPTWLLFLPINSTMNELRWLVLCLTFSVLSYTFAGQTRGWAWAWA